MSQEHNKKPIPLKEEKKRTEFGERPLRESYQPENDDLDSSSPPQGSGVPQEPSKPPERNEH